MNPYGNYTPAEALRDTGNSLADMMKSFLAVKVENAKLDVEEKKLDLETAKTRGGMEKDVSLQQLAQEKDLADIRHKGQELDLKRSGQEAEAGYRDRIAGVYERRAGVDEQQLAIQQREEARLNREDTFGNMIIGSNLPAAVKQVMKKNTDPEEWGRKTTVRDFKDGVENFFKQNPSVMIGGLVMGLGLKVRQAEEKIKNAKSDEEVNAIFEKELEPATYHMMELRMMLGDGPELTEKDRQTYAQLGMKAYAASPENYTNEADAIEKATAAGTALKKAYWEEKFPGKEKGKEKALKMSGVKKPDAADDPKAIVMTKLNELEGMKPQLEQAGLNLDKIKKNVQKSLASGNLDKAGKTIENALTAVKTRGQRSEDRGQKKQEAGLTQTEERQLSGMQGVPLGLTGAESMAPVIEGAAEAPGRVKTSIQDVLAEMDEKTQGFKEDVSERLKSRRNLRDILKYGN